MTICCTITIVGLLVCTHTAAQTSVALIDAPYTRIGRYQSQPAHALLAATNPALLPNYKGFTATAFGEKRFLLNELSHVQLGIVLPVSAGAFALQSSSFGSAAHRQSKVGLAYGRRLNEQLNVGVQFHYLHYAISGYGQAGAMNAAAGVLYRISSTLTAGLQLDNVAATKLGASKSEAVPQVISAGLGYAPSSSFYAEATMVKEGAKPIGLEASLQYAVQDKLLVKGGITTANATFYFGAGYSLGTWQMEAIASWHPYLGVTPGLMLTYKKAKE